jgi:Transglutaminase-like superfamily
MFYYRRQKDCLPKALTTFHLLRRQGIPADLCFGVKKFPFSAHTWVEAFGESLDDDPLRLQHYTVIHRVAD